MSFDWEWIKSDIDKLLKNEPITINEYDYENNALIHSNEKTKEIDYIIFEGLLSLYDHEINSKSILNIFIDEKSDECLIRRIKRDIKERGRELDSILEQWRDSVAEMYHVYVKNLKYKADIICPHINSKNFVNFIENVLEK
jgi:uridine kinase